jgi:hypothetical protein
MRRTSLCLAAALLIAAGAQVSAVAAPRNQNCANLSEVALLAKAMAEENVDKNRALAILRRIYSIPDHHARSFARLVIDSAYTDNSSAGEFAQRFEVVCLSPSGERPTAESRREPPRLRM